jgi:Flp pilus assembly protein TadG
MRRLAMRLADADRSRGAAAVEFAIVLPLLLLIVFGVVDFGRAYNAKVTLAQAAREGARLEALSASLSLSAIQVAATGFGGVTVSPPTILKKDGTILSGVTSCTGLSSDYDVKVMVTYQFSYLTPLPALIRRTTGPITLTGVGEMPCAG